MSVESSVYGAADAAFGWGWNIFLGRPSPMEIARIQAETAEAVRKAGGSEAEVKNVLEQQARDYVAQEAARNKGGCTSSVDHFIGCLEKVRKAVTVVAVVAVVVVALPYAARAYREVKKSFK